MRTLDGRHRYFNAMFNYGREWPRIAGGQHETKDDALAEVREAMKAKRPIERPCSAWVEGFEKDEHGNVERIC